MGREIALVSQVDPKLIINSWEANTLKWVVRYRNLNIN
jgi:hypothetical protein